MSEDPAAYKSGCRGKFPSEATIYFLVFWSLLPSFGSTTGILWYFYQIPYHETCIQLLHLVLPTGTIGYPQTVILSLSQFWVMVLWVMVLWGKKWLLASFFSGWWSLFYCRTIFNPFFPDMCELEVSLGGYLWFYTFFWPAEFPGYHQ